jgi:hypothetical protein
VPFNFHGRIIIVSGREHWSKLPAAAAVSAYIDGSRNAFTT